jgi:hypothetical protein
MARCGAATAGCLNPPEERSGSAPRRRWWQRRRLAQRRPTAYGSACRTCTATSPIRCCASASPRLRALHRAGLQLGDDVGAGDAFRTRFLAAASGGRDDGPGVAPALRPDARTHPRQHHSPAAGHDGQQHRCPGGWGHSTAAGGWGRSTAAGGGGRTATGGWGNTAAGRWGSTATKGWGNTAAATAKERMVGHAAGEAGDGRSGGELSPPTHTHTHTHTRNHPLSAPPVRLAT